MSTSRAARAMRTGCSSHPASPALPELGTEPFGVVQVEGGRATRSGPRRPHSAATVSARCDVVVALLGRASTGHRRREARLPRWRQPSRVEAVAMFMEAAQVSDTPFTPLRLMQNVIHAERSHLWCYVAATRSAVAAASPVGSRPGVRGVLNRGGSASALPGLGRGHCGHRPRADEPARWWSPLNIAIYFSRRVGRSLDLLEQAFPGAVAPPQPMRFVDGLSTARPQPFGQVTQLNPGPSPVQNSVDDLPVIPPPATTTVVGRQERPRPFPFGISGGTR